MAGSKGWRAWTEPERDALRAWDQARPDQRTTQLELADQLDRTVEAVKAELGRLRQRSAAADAWKKAPR